MKTLKITFSLILCLIAGVSFSQNLDFKKPSNFEIEKFDGKTLIFSFKMTVENANSKGFGVTIKRGKVYKDGEYVGTFKLLKKIKLKKKPKENLFVRGKIEFEKEIDLKKEGKKGLKNLLSGKSGGNQSQLKLTGIIKATWFIFWKKFPFEYETSMNLGSFMK